MVSQWRSSVNLHNWNTGRPLEAHWKHTGHQQLLIHWHSSVHSGLTSRHTGSPLGYHWLRVGESFFYTDTLTIEIKYGLPYCVTYPSMSTDPGSLNPGTRRSRVVGSRDPYEYRGRWHSFGKTYLICIIAQVLENYFHTPYWRSSWRHIRFSDYIAIVFVFTVYCVLGTSLLLWILCAYLLLLLSL